jgi:hypothetical protein
VISALLHANARSRFPGYRQETGGAIRSASQILGESAGGRCLSGFSQAFVLDILVRIK